MVTKEEARKQVESLLKEFEAYKNNPNFSDMHIENKTKDWIDALFKCLGWDIKTEVTKEQATGRMKRVDYAFRIDNTIKFLLEAKNYNENLDDHVEQAVAYGYQKTIRWIVLSNFKEIRIYNSQYWGLDYEVMRLFSPIKISEFLTRFDDLWVLSKESFETKLIEDLATKYGKVKPKEPITIHLSVDFARWRELLTKGITEHKNLNSIPSDRERAEIYLDEAVQRILDRILFIRVAEDRGIEDPILEQILKDHKSNKTPISEHLKNTFRILDEVYNSGLFAEHYSENLVIDDNILSKVIEETYKSPTGLPYDFEAINADILGSVYEQYLGMLLKRTAKRTTIKTSHKRKEGGVYYTPTYIVDYIVKNTVGEVIKNKKTEQLENIKVLDPACGSGSFLIKAFDKIENHYTSESRQQKIKSFSYILTQNLYGMDIDQKAVEIAQLNLLLKAAATKHKLPELEAHIKCKDSLIDPKLDESYQKEDLYNIIKEGGFDAVIGNPPYIDSEEMTKSQPESRKLYSKLYPKSAVGNWDIFCIFLDRGLSLVRNKGYFGMIVPNKLLSADYANGIRKVIGKYRIVSIRDYSSIPVFKDANVYPIIIIVQKIAPNTNHKILVEVLDMDGPEIKVTYSNEVTQKELTGTSNNNWSHVLNESGSEIISKMNDNATKLKNGLATVLGAATVSEAYELKSLIKEDSCDSFRMINTGTIDRYNSLWGIKKMHYIKSVFEKPTITKNELKKLYERRYEQASKTKIIVAGMSKVLECYLDESGKYLAGKSTTIVIPERINSKLLLAILNSKLISFYYKTLFKALALAGGYMNVGPPEIESLPIKLHSKEDEQKIVELVDQIIELNKEKGKTVQKSDKWNSIKSKIESIDHMIDEYIYKLYGITDAQKESIEKNYKK